MKEIQNINTLKKFLQVTKFARGHNHPSVTTLKQTMKELNIHEELTYDIMTFFLYDNESTDEDLTPDMIHSDHLFCTFVKQNIPNRK
jgi:hypothetical protein